MAQRPNGNIDPVRKLREMMSDPEKLILCPGVYDGFTARIALQVGFDCLYMTGAGTTMSRLGMPDLGVATLNDMRDHAAMIASSDRTVPLIADMDTGYGGALMVGRAVEQYIHAGVAGFHIEDQVTSKRCGHLQGKQLVNETEWFSRIRAAVNARQKTGRDIVIIARTDALQSLGFDAAVKRLKGALELGADVAFLEGIDSKEQGRRACQELAPVPVLLNMVQGGLTPRFTAEEAKEHGFRLMICATLALNRVYAGVWEAFEQLKKSGKSSEDERQEMGPRELFMVCGLQEATDFDLAAGGAAYETGV